MSSEYPLEGKTFGDYRLERGLGHGGTADVYLGKDTVLERYVAVKVINTRLPPEPQEIEEFKKEALTLAKLEHPHIVDVYRYGVKGNVPYIVMRLAQNGSVRQKHYHGSVLPFETVVDYVRQISEALQYAHDHGLVHRDVKPENMLFGSSGELLLSDFGIAVPTASRRIYPEEIVGTILYMAPEQFEAKAVRQSDQYSLGVVIYEWLTGGLPFAVTTSVDAAYQHKIASVPPMTCGGLSIPPEIEAVVRKALAKDPQDRFETITDFAQALAKAVRLNTLPAA